MKSLSHNIGIVLVLLVFALALVLPVSAQNKPKPKRKGSFLLTDWSYPEYDEQGVIKSRVAGETAQFVDENRIEIRNLNLIIYSDGKENVNVTGELCFFDTRKGTVNSDDIVEITQDNVFMSGKGLTWNSGSGNVIVRSRVKIRVMDPGEGLGSTNTVFITADSLEYAHMERRCVLEGRVRVHDGAMTVAADQATVLLGEERSVNNVTAIGNVRIEQDDTVATCGLAVVDTAEEKMVLTEKVTIDRPGEQVRGEKIVFLKKQNRVISEPGYVRLTGKTRDSKWIAMP